MSKDLPAFPLPREIAETLPNIGLTKREYFAALAMQGLLSSMVDRSGNGSWANPSENNDIAVSAIRIADELLKQLES